MRRETRTSALIVVLGLATLGCASGPGPRYVYQDGVSGVIGLPENTSKWPTYYRKHAEELMARHFPEGYEIVRAEEVEEGFRTLTINGSRSAELDPTVSGQLVALGKIGRSASRSQSDTLKIKECRIVYRKATPHPPDDHGDYAEQAGWTPAPYVDPNAEARATPKAKASASPGPGELAEKSAGPAAETSPKATPVQETAKPSGLTPTPEGELVHPRVHQRRSSLPIDGARHG